MSDTDQDRPENHRVALDARDWLVRLTSGSLSAAELEQFKLWRDCRPEHRAAFDHERRFWNQLDRLAPPAGTIAQVQTSGMTRRSLIGGGAALAAASAGFVAAPRVSLWWKADFIVPAGSQREVPLPDGTVAAVNTGGALKVDFRTGLRLVHLLRGDAEFRIPPAADGSPFRIAAGGGNTDMPDGHMTIGYADDLTTVAVVAGHAAVYSPLAPDETDLSQRPRVDLAPSQQTTYLSGANPGQPGAADLEMLLAWRRGKIIFEGKPFAAAISDIGRYVAEPVILRPGIDRELAVSGIFSTTQPLAALQSLAKTQALSVRRIPGVAIILA
ncbi:FecR family protein [Rhizobium panacihumi]|uniref:FecR family protein n=1 Tax=Rhizobium panacihumi TaxID=2008450 RepID=UPI003D7B223E